MMYNPLLVGVPDYQLDDNLGKLPFISQIKNILNDDERWNDFTSRLTGRYTCTSAELKSFNKFGDRVFNLINKLRSRGMTIREFINYASLAQIVPILQLFNIRVPVQITHQPFPLWWNVTVGESVTLKVMSSGSPRYQWYRNEQQVINGIANTNVLVIPSASVEDTGVYICQVTSVEDSIVLKSDPVQIIVSELKPLKIKEHPQSFTLGQNGNGFLKCEVWADVEVDYQWMRNGKEVTDDSEHISGSNTNKLEISRVQIDDHTGIYYCRISRGEEVIFTQEAVLQVSSPITYTPSKFTASDKIALIMGAGDYMSERLLVAPKHDVQRMSTVFQNLGFKVVSLLNLSRKEMIAAIHEFKDLVDEGVYCVFYFCGHGYEAAGQCFLLPPDAPQGYTQDQCISADAILFNVLLPRKPQFCCMILDICRLRLQGVPEMLRTAVADYIICYATCPGDPAFEQEDSSILVRHLKNILLSNIGIEETFQRLREQIKHDPALNDEKRQAPEIRAVLPYRGISFHDPINFTGYTQAYGERQLKWEAAHVLPQPIDKIVNFPGFDVFVKLEFQADFSNALTIFTTVLDAGLAKSCKAHVKKIPIDVAENAKVQCVDDTFPKSSLQLHHIQRLKSDMHVMVLVTCTMADGTVHEETFTENLGMPLVSPLHLWKDYPNVIRYQEAEEADVQEFTV